MQTYQKAFIELALKQDALRFGEFTLKSGRKSPYFFNVGQLNSGDVLKTIGECYAHAIIAQAPQFDVLFGPAYKGIPLACATAIALSNQKHHVPYSFNRKEAKDHGEGGVIIGAALQNRKVLIIDDVITAGTAVRESFEIIEKEQGKIAGIFVALDRQEKGQGAKSAIEEIQENFGIPVKAIITLENIMEYVDKNPNFGSFIEPLTVYREQYGIC